jgi:hypothetical protein
MVRVWFRPRAELIAENLFLRRQLALHQEQGPTSTDHAGCETRADRLEPVLPVGTDDRDYQAEHIRSLAPSWISAVLAVTIPSGRSATTSQEPSSTHLYHGERKSELGGGAHC